MSRDVIASPHEPGGGVNVDRWVGRGSTGRPLGDLPPILGKMDLRKRVECRRRERNEPNEIGLF
jgi:hypothetical protein